MEFGMKKIYNKAKFISLMICLSFLTLPLMAQTISVTGEVRDSDNEPLPGATIIIKDSSVGTVTDIDGNYSMNVPEDAILVYSFVGFDTHEENVAGRTVINVILNYEDQSLDELVVVGYATQRKVTLTGAVSGIKGSDMIQTRNENPQNMLTGRIPGVRVWQKSAEPGSFNNSFDIRGLGSPLVVIDGVPRDVGEFQRLNPNDIEDISVLKDASAAIYGVRAANGVVLVTTKKGTKDGSTNVALNASYTFQRPSGMPILADPYETMTLYNERAMNNISGGNIIYTESDFEAFRSGARRTTDWTSLLFSNYSPQMQQDLSITGGGEKTQFYIGVGYMYQEGFFKSGDLNYNKTNIRSNITTELFEGLTFDLNLSGIADQRNNPYSSSVDIIRNYWRQGVLFPAYADPDNTMLNYEGLDLEENSIAMMTSDISGYRKYAQKYFQSSAGLNYDFGTLSPQLTGLSARALISYDYRMDDNNINRREYYQYAYNNQTDSYDAKLYSNSSPNQIRRELYSKQQVLGQFILNYNRTFNDLHSFSGLLGWESQKRSGDNFYAQRDLAFQMDYLFAGIDENQIGGMQSGSNDIYDLSNSAMIGRINYAYDDRYIAEAQFRYDGSSKFAKGHQWGFFPSASAAWRISREPFFQDTYAATFVDELKLRASYGVLGDDGQLQYDWATGYVYPATSGNAAEGYYNQYAPGNMFGGEFVYGVSTLALPNRMITWFTAHTFDVGVDFEGWNGLFGFAFDFFNRTRYGRFARRGGELPTVVGATAPRENLDSDRHFGMDLSLSHRNRIGELYYRVGAMGTITRNQYLTASEKGPYGNSLDRWRNDNLTNRYQGMQFGYESLGRYSNWEDIWSHPIYKDRNILPGDYKYVDWNGDGEINGQDTHPIAFDQTPWLNYSLTFDGNYRNFDMSLLLQGSALGSMEYREPLYSIWGSNGGGTLVQYLDRWHPIDPLADPYNPEIDWNSGYYGFTGNYPFSNSRFNRVSTAYLRLKSIELGYTLPKINSLNTMEMRVFANAYNLLTLTGVKFVDPEHPDDDLGRMYPLNKTFTVGLSLKF